MSVCHSSPRAQRADPQSIVVDEIRDDKDFRIAIDEGTSAIHDWGRRGSPNRAATKASAGSILCRRISSNTVFDAKGGDGFE